MQIVLHVDNLRLTIKVKLPDWFALHADGAVAQPCWLQQGAGQAAEGLAVLGDSAQRARTGAGFKYQDVVRRKAERAALEVCPKIGDGNNI